ncbi:hypothetical protein NUU61_008645 [Penicillium alfredii]|uniref:Malate dehydrogenase n=1 Tax=Penicillium alfredii TaxID=1506179 RepID=A0A9W9ELP2_9EURO|nr:uncharacterized protein NUU61_008645 [Penicillium alfredii]KAJ5084066.1 hypothetical protein NUU61_008645 [Penicillium alfredii]
MASTRYYANPKQAGEFATNLLLKAGLNDGDAKSMADVRGVDTHGLARLPQYLDRVHNGRVKAQPNISITCKAPVMAHLDGDNGFGFIVATNGMNEAIQRPASERGGSIC